MTIITMVVATIAQHEHLDSSSYLSVSYARLACCCHHDFFFSSSSSSWLYHHHGQHYHHHYQHHHRHHPLNRKMIVILIHHQGLHGCHAMAEGHHDYHHHQLYQHHHHHHHHHHQASGKHLGSERGPLAFYSVKLRAIRPAALRTFCLLSTFGYDTLPEEQHRSVRAFLAAQYPLLLTTAEGEPAAHARFAEWANTGGNDQVQGQMDAIRQEDHQRALHFGLSSRPTSPRPV